MLYIYLMDITIISLHYYFISRCCCAPQYLWNPWRHRTFFNGYLSFILFHTDHIVELFRTTSHNSSSNNKYPIVNAHINNDGIYMWHVQRLAIWHSFTNRYQWLIFSKIFSNTTLTLTLTLTLLLLDTYFSISVVFDNIFEKI